MGECHLRSDQELPTVLLIDDEDIINDLIDESLRESCHIDYVDSGEKALRYFETRQPDLVILDVEMPDIDGYETCRKIRLLENVDALPIVFLSGHTEIEDRLKGYEAGGDEYLIKPFNILELRAKVLHLLASTASRAELHSMANLATNAAMTAMTSMSELGSLFDVVKGFTACHDANNLAQTIANGLAIFGLQSVVRVRILNSSVVITNHGSATPLEESVVEQMAAMERIVSFKNRLSITYDNVAILVSNMPIADAERCGRIRDHLAMLVEIADTASVSIASRQQANLRGAVIEQTVGRISEALRLIDREQRQDKIRERLAVEELLTNHEKALMSVALTEAQEKYVSEVIREGIEKMLNTQAEEFSAQNQLTEIVRELNAVLNASGNR